MTEEVSSTSDCGESLTQQGFLHKHNAENNNVSQKKTCTASTFIYFPLSGVSFYFYIFIQCVSQISEAPRQSCGSSKQHCKLAQNSGSQMKANDLMIC